LPFYEPCFSWFDLLRFAFWTFWWWLTAFAAEITVRGVIAAAGAYLLKVVLPCTLVNPAGEAFNNLEQIFRVD